MVAYGQDKIDYLQKHYGEGENPDVGDECASEWESMKRFLGERFKEKSMREMISILTTDTSIQSLYPNLSKLASIAAIIPVSTAECERSFSAMKRIKTALRNRLKTTTLDCLIRVNIEGPSLSEFNFERAADIWQRMRNHRLRI